MSVESSTMKLVGFKHIQQSYKHAGRGLRAAARVLQGDYEVTAWTPTNSVTSLHVLLFLLLHCLFFYPLLQ